MTTHAWHTTLARYFVSRAATIKLTNRASHCRALGWPTHPLLTEDKTRLTASYAYNLGHELGFHGATDLISQTPRGADLAGTIFGSFGRACYVSVIAHQDMVNGRWRLDNFTNAGDKGIYSAAFCRPVADADPDDEYPFLEFFCLDSLDWQHEDDVFHGPFGQTYSQDCDYIEHCVSCETHCEDTVSVVDGRYNNTGDFICGSCLDERGSDYVRIDSPRGGQAAVSRDYAAYVEGEWVHIRRAEDDASVCEGCHEMFWQDNLHHCETSEGFYCSDCFSDVEQSCKKIKGYHDSEPTALGWFAENSTRCQRDVRYFGFELEVEPAKHHVISAIADNDLSLLDSWTTLEHDGSLDAGCEIISAPHTLSRMRERFSGEALSRWNLALKHCRSHDTTTCGLHVHVSRVGLHPNMGLFLQTFMARNGNGRFLDIIAQRKENDYCLRRMSDSQRYMAVNLTNAETIEFRLFKGNIRADRVLKAIEFVDALLAYLTPDVESFGWQAFVAWLSHRVSRYPVLCSYLMERGVQVEDGYEVASQPGLPGLEDTIASDPNLAALLATMPIDNADPVYAP